MPLCLRTQMGPKGGSAAITIGAVAHASALVPALAPHSDAPRPLLDRRACLEFAVQTHRLCRLVPYGPR